MALDTLNVLIMALSLLLVATVVFLQNSISKFILMIIIAVAEIISCIMALETILESMSDKWRAVLGGATNEEIVEGIAVTAVIYAGLYIIGNAIWNRIKTKRRTKDGFND